MVQGLDIPTRSIRGFDDPKSRAHLSAAERARGIAVTPDVQIPEKQSAFRRFLPGIIGTAIGGPGIGMLAQGVFGGKNTEREDALKLQAAQKDKGMQEYATILKLVSGSGMTFDASNTPARFPLGWKRMMKTGAIAIQPGGPPKSVTMVQAKLRDDGQVDSRHMTEDQVKNFLDAMQPGENKELKSGSTFVSPSGRTVASNRKGQIIKPGEQFDTGLKDATGQPIIREGLKRFPPIVSSDAIGQQVPGGGALQGLFGKGKKSPEDLQAEILEAKQRKASGGKDAQAVFVADLIARAPDLVDLLGPERRFAREVFTLGTVMVEALGKVKAMNLIHFWLSEAKKGDDDSLTAYLTRTGKKQELQTLERAQGGKASSGIAPGSRPDTGTSIWEAIRNWASNAISSDI